MINEQELIDSLKEKFPFRDGIGDDAAILPLSRTQRYVVSKDILVENIHFRRAYFTAADLAHKTLHINLSDIAAMGGKPLYLFIGMALPTSFERDLPSFIEALAQASQEQQIIVMGGDTTATYQGVLMISATIIGQCALKALKRRKGAKVGDIIALAGDLGYAHLGFRALEQASQALGFESHCLRPQARVPEGLWLGQQVGVTSMMDVSDGLWVDLKRLSKTGHVFSALNVRRLISYQTQPFLEACRLITPQGLDPLQVQLAGGEDYGLLFTVRPHQWPRLSQAFFSQFHYPLKRIGVILKSRRDKNFGGVVLTQSDGGETLLENPNFTSIKPFTHFGESIERG